MLYALTGRVAGTDLPQHTQMMLMQKLRKVVPVLQAGVEVRGDALQYWAATRIQRALREWLARRRAVRGRRSQPSRQVSAGPDDYWSCSDDGDESNQRAAKA